MKKNFYIWDGVYKNFDSTGYNEISQGFSSQKYLDNNLKDLLTVSDVLSVCCPASKETVDMINKETIEYLPKGAVVTNVARGDIIEDEAMVDALDRRKVYAVGLDVYKNEPNLNKGYYKHKSAFILPHLGSATKETRTAMANLAIDNLDEYFKTGSCKNKVN